MTNYPSTNDELYTPPHPDITKDQRIEHLELIIKVRDERIGQLEGLIERARELLERGLR